MGEFMAQRDKDLSGYYLFPTFYLALGIWQLSFPEGRMFGGVAIAVAIFAGIVAFRARRKLRDHNEMKDAPGENAGE
jgi:hypothetical protein